MRILSLLKGRGPSDTPGLHSRYIAKISQFMAVGGDAHIAPAEKSTKYENLRRIRNFLRADRGVNVMNLTGIQVKETEI